MDITLKITDKLARQLYPGATNELKSILEESCGGRTFFDQKITDRVHSLEDVFEVMGIDPDDFYNDNDTDDERAYKEMKVVTKCLNEDWVPNFDDVNEPKWYLWFDLQKSKSNPSGFRLNGVVYTFTDTSVGSRLCFKTEPLAQLAFKIIENSYRIYHTLNAA